jgi:hypothetical protein
MNMGGLRSLGLHVVLFALLLGVVNVAAAAGGPSQSRPSTSRRANIDLTASAIPGPGKAHVVEVAYRNTRTRRAPFKADATANASTTCASCTADATVLDIVYVDGVEASVDNVATAWAHCGDCRAAALSVQVVVVHGRTRLRANNRALGVDAGCDSCRSAAAAFQLVVSSKDGARLSRTERRELRQWVAEKARTLRTATAASSDQRTTEAPGSGIGGLDRLVNDALGSTTVKRDARTSG